MRLTLRFLLAAVLPVALILLGNGYLRVQREVRLLTEEVTIHQRAVGQSLSAAALHVWRREGPEGVAEMVHEANRRERLIDIRFLAGSAQMLASRYDESIMTRLRTDEIFVEGSPHSAQQLRSVVPVRDDAGAIIGALELTEQLDREDAYLQRTLWLVGSQTLLVALAVALVMTVMGWALIARRVQALVDLIRRIGGSTDAGSSPEITRGDEFDLLTHEVRVMQARLDEAQAKLDEETSLHVRTVEQLRHADRLSTVGRLASGIAHELGTPLNVIIGRAQMLEAGVAPDKAVAYGQIIARQGERMSTIVRQLLDFSRRRPPNTQATELKDLVEKTVTLLRAAARKRGVALELDASEVEATVDRLQMDQVITNLVMNAIQACGEGDVVTVSTGVDRASECAFVRVMDTGVGVAREIQDQIFDPFFTTKDIGEGTGLGLAVAHGIVSDHAGRIEVESLPGAGATFTVYLPRQWKADPNRQEREV